MNFNSIGFALAVLGALPNMEIQSICTAPRGVCAIAKRRRRTVSGMDEIDVGVDRDSVFDAPTTDDRRRALAYRVQAAFGRRAPIIPCDKQSLWNGQRSTLRFAADARRV
jgi:hypothetical protein